MLEKAPDGTQLPPNCDVMGELAKWDGKVSLVVEIAPQPLGNLRPALPDSLPDALPPSKDRYSAVQIDSTRRAKT